MNWGNIPLSHDRPFIIGLFVRAVSGITFILVLVLYFRMFSKNYAQRRKENEIFLKYKNQAVRFLTKKTDDSGPGEIPYLHLSQLRTEDSYSQRKGKDRYHLSEMQNRIHQKKLKSDFSFFYILLQLRSAGFEEIFFVRFAQIEITGLAPPSQDLGESQNFIVDPE